MMSQRHGWMRWAGTALLAGNILLGGCATKSGMVTTSGTEPSPAGPARTGGPAAPAQTSQSGRMQTDARTPGAGENRETGSGAGGPISGFSRNPAEERVTQPAPLVVAKAEPPETHGDKAHDAAGRQLADIYFAFDKWNLSAEGKKNLADSAQYLQQHPDAKLVIEGYCDERGSREYNLVLGEKRAKESMRYLAALGIKNPMSITSYGKERQVCSEHGEACYWKNRRGHLVLMEGQP